MSLRCPRQLSPNMHDGERRARLRSPLREVPSTGVDRVVVTNVLNGGCADTVAESTGISEGREEGSVEWWWGKRYRVVDLPLIRPWEVGLRSREDVAKGSHRSRPTPSGCSRRRKERTIYDSELRNSRTLQLQER